MLTPENRKFPGWASLKRPITLSGIEKTKKPLVEGSCIISGILKQKMFFLVMVWLSSRKEKTA
jgi:hypothetical protein